ncbi:MAG: hypothetical protein ATN35_02650 [Epulopiscium sp. Nele67-Bin004]|nr:MAG: hypothetical protein ATN35_02650 [Epulopiscium sp. Nele67-Bin004]
MSNLKNLMENYGITTAEAQQKVEMEMQSVQQQLMDTTRNYKSINWDSQVNEQCQKIYNLKAILQTEGIKDSIQDTTINRLDAFIDKCQGLEFQIALVGAIKAGKSTLVNALLDMDLASVSVTPETASLTKFRQSDNGKNYVKLTFYTQNEWNQLWQSVQKSKAEVFIDSYKKLNAEREKGNWVGKAPEKREFKDLGQLKEEIKKWTSSTVATHYFVKEVEVGLANSAIPEGIVYVDTPGLDDPVAYRSDITRKYIARANAVLVCVKSDSLTGSEIATIASTFANTRYNPEKVYVIGTQLDALNRPEEHWAKQKAVWLDLLSKKEYFGNPSLAQQNLIGIAAFVYNLVINYDNLDEDSKWDLDNVAVKFRIRDTEANLEQLKSISNMHELKDKLEREILSKFKQLYADDIKNSYQTCKTEVVGLLTDLKENQISILQTADKGLDEIRAKKQKSEEELKEAEKEKAELEKFLRQMNKFTEQRSKDLYTAIRKLGGKVNVAE